MTLYLQLACYSAEGSKAVIDGGLAARRSAVEEMIRAVGGSVIGYYAVTNGEWHVAALVDLPSNLSHADLGRLEMMQVATGGVERLSLLPLASPEDFDSASRAGEGSYRAPGKA
ncbi:MAG: GYD domain-containing protein [Acidimicrobiia bacterium]|nr:GYD domain-containing protein [Acidimicrobiia bacterium]